MRLTSWMLAAAAALIVAPRAQCQDVATSEERARPGGWAAEVAFGAGGVSGANLLRIKPSGMAWLAGLDFDLRQANSRRSHPSLGWDNLTESDSWHFTSVGTRAGVRRYRGATDNRLRPFLGGGLLLAYQSYGAEDREERSSSVGGYGELGASYFFTPHVSLGAVGGLRATYTVQRVDFGVGAQRTRTVAVDGNLVRILGAVYF